MCNKMARNTPVTKTLTIANINKEGKMLDEQVTVKVVSTISGEEYILKIDKHFKQSKILQLVTEIMAQIQTAKAKKININAIFVPYSLMMVLKHFSSLGKEVPTELNQQIALLNRLIDLGMIEPIFAVLPQEEMNKVFTQITKTIGEMDADISNTLEKLSEMEGQMDEGEITFKD